MRLLPTTMLAFFRARLILSQHGHRGGVHRVCYAWDRVERLSSRRSRILSHRDHSYLAEISPVFSQQQCSSSRKRGDEAENRTKRKCCLQGFRNKSGFVCVSISSSIFSPSSSERKRMGIDQTKIRIDDSHITIS